LGGGEGVVVRGLGGDALLRGMNFLSAGKSKTVERRKMKTGGLFDGGVQPTYEAVINGLGGKTAHEEGQEAGPLAHVRSSVSAS